MERRILLLRGINLGPRNRIAMPELRSALAAEGFEDVRTYVQSGNVVLGADDAPEEVARACEQVIARRFGLDVPVVARSRDEVAGVVRRNPLGAVAVEPKRYQVSFLASEPPAGLEETLAAVAAGPERVVVDGREIYAWHPAGVARSKLSALLAGPRLGVTATARNWTTVNALLALADGAAA